MRVIELREHSRAWKLKFQKEEALLLAVLPSIAVAVHHIGSTAIPNIKAKETIDILLEVANIRDLRTMNEVMKKAGYVAKGECGISGREFCIKGGEKRHVHLHAFEVNHLEITRHVLFVEYLRQHPERALEYQRIKERAQAAYRTEPDRYTEAKSAFVAQIDREAHAWKCS